MDFNNNLYPTPVNNPEGKLNKKIHPLYKINEASLKSKLPAVDLVIPAHNNQEQLNLIVTALAQLEYPKNLLTIHLLDDGSDPKLKVNNNLPFKVKNYYKEKNPYSWGKSSIVNEYLPKLKGDYLWFIDSDMVVEKNHLLHLISYALTNTKSIILGYKKFVREYSLTPDELKNQLKNKEFKEIFPESYKHDYWEELVVNSNYCQDLNHDIFKAMVGATFLIKREDMLNLGGYQKLPAGEDTVLGYQAYTQGFKFIPVPYALSYHLGSSTMQNHQEAMLSHNMALLADYIPSLYHYRNQPFTQYKTNHTTVYYNYTGESYDKFLKNLRAINTLSTSFEIIFPIDLDLLSKKYSILKDEYKELRKIHNFYKSTPNIKFIPKEKESLNKVLRDFKHKESVFTVYLDGGLENLLDFKKIFGFFRSSGYSLIGALDNYDNKIIVTAPNFLNQPNIGEQPYYQIVDLNQSIWFNLESFNRKVQARKAYWKFLKYIFRRIKTIRNFNDIKTFTIKGKIIIKNYLNKK